MTKQEVIRFLVLRTIGNFLLLSAVFGVIATFGPALYYEITFRLSEARGVQYIVQTESTSALGEILEKSQNTPARSGLSFGNILSGNKEQVLIPSDTDFSILIPKIGASSRVTPNVDPSNEEAFLPVLQSSVAHAEGTVFPGMPGNIYLFAHSTDSFWDVGRYNAIFYLIKNLEKNDDISVFFEGVRYNYKVSESKIVDASDVSYILNSKTGKERLILQTCWPPGTTWKRLLVFADPR